MPRYRLRDKVLLQKLSDEAVILNLLDGQYYGLDAVGARMVALVMEHGECSAALRQLESEYEADGEQLRADLESLLAQLHDKGLIELVD